MNLAIKPALLLTLFALPVIASAQQPQTLALGSPAPAFNLPGTDGRPHKLSDYAASKVLVVAFLCNHCTQSQLYESRIQRLADTYRDKGVALVAIQSANPAAIPIEDLAFSDVGESLADMKLRAAYRHLTFPYLFDGDTQKAARLFGPAVAPQVFIFDRTRKLRYVGRVDDNPTESLATTHDAANAIDALLAGTPVATAQTTATGCPIPIGAAARPEPPTTEPVTLALAGASELTKLRTNPTGKLLLINFFATWCGPCVSEFPNLVDTYRMYRSRDFALTIVSSNDPEEQPDVLKFLQKMHATTTNLLFATSDIYAMQAAFDPNMGAAVPFTVILDPKGGAIFQQSGNLDILEMRRAILANLPDDPAHQGSQAYWSKK